MTQNTGVVNSGWAGAPRVRPAPFHRPTGEGALPAQRSNGPSRAVSPNNRATRVSRRAYMVTSGGIVTCVDSKTGKVIYRGRVNARCVLRFARGGRRRCL